MKEAKIWKTPNWKRVEPKLQSLSTYGKFIQASRFFFIVNKLFYLNINLQWRKICLLEWIFHKSKDFEVWVQLFFSLEFSIFSLPSIIHSFMLLTNLEKKQAPKLLVAGRKVLKKRKPIHIETCFSSTDEVNELKVVEINIVSEKMKIKHEINAKKPGPINLICSSGFCIDFNQNPKSRMIIRSRLQFHKLYKCMYKIRQRKMEKQLYLIKNLLTGFPEITQLKYLFSILYISISKYT